MIDPQRAQPDGPRHTTGRVPLETLVLVGVLALGALLRLVNLGHSSLWLDEIHTVRMAAITMPGTIQHPGDQHPPLYYLLMHYWSQVGQSEFWLRLPSALGGFVGVCLMWPIGKAMHNRQLGLLAAIILAFSPLHLWYSREARMYGLASGLWAASLYFYIQGLRRERWGDVLGFAVTTVAGIYTAYPTLGLWASELIGLMALWPAYIGNLQRRVRWGIAHGLIVLGILPWWPVFWTQMQNPVIFRWDISANVADELVPSALGSLRDPFIRWLTRIDFSSTLDQTIRHGLVLWLGLMIGVWMGAAWLARRPHWLARLHRWASPAAGLIVGGLIGVTLVSAIPGGLSVRRQLLVFFVLFGLLAAWALIRLRRRWITMGVVSLTLALGGATAFGPPLEDWRGVADWVARQALPSDEIVLTPVQLASAFNYYYHGNSRAWSIDPGELDARGSTLLIPGRRVWVVLNQHPVYRNDSQPAEAWFGLHYCLLTTHAFEQYLVVLEYQPSEHSSCP